MKEWDFEIAQVVSYTRYLMSALHGILGSRSGGFTKCGADGIGAESETAIRTASEIDLVAYRCSVSGVSDRPTIANTAVSTSGGLYQTVNIDGVNYSHIHDPSRGLGLTRSIAASVITRTATVSDALATAACVAGSERAVNEIETWGGTAARVVTQKNDVPRVVMSRGFE